MFFFVVSLDNTWYQVRIWKASVPLLGDPPLVSFLVNHCVASRTFVHDGDRGTMIIIYWFYTRLTCVHVELISLAQPIPNTTTSLPRETHPAQRTSITLTSGSFIGGFRPARVLIVDCCVLWFFGNLGVLEAEQSFKDEEPPIGRSWEDNRSARRALLKIATAGDTASRERCG